MRSLRILRFKLKVSVNLLNVLILWNFILTIPIHTEKLRYKDVFERTIEILQRARIFKGNCYLKVHNALLKLLVVSPILV